MQTGKPGKAFPRSRRRDATTHAGPRRKKKIAAFSSTCDTKRKNRPSGPPKNGDPLAVLVEGCRRGTPTTKAALGKEESKHHDNQPKEKHQKPGRRPREAGHRGDGEAPRQHAANRAVGELVHAGPDHQQASAAGDSALRRGRRQGHGRGEDRQRRSPSAGSDRSPERARVVREGDLRDFA